MAHLGYNMLEKVSNTQYVTIDPCFSKTDTKSDTNSATMPSLIDVASSSDSSDSETTLVPPSDALIFAMNTSAEDYNGLLSTSVTPFPNLGSQNNEFEQPLTHAAVLSHTHFHTFKPVPFYMTPGVGVPNIVQTNVQTNFYFFQNYF